MGTGLLIVLAVLYVAALVTLGITCLRKGQWIWFTIGLVVPVFWLIGALMPSRRAEVS
jgi:hypothetical protein